MTFEQVDDTAAAVSSEVANIRGISFITEAFDQEEVALILAVGVRRLQEWQVLQKEKAPGRCNLVCQTAGNLWVQCKNHLGMRRG